MIIDVRMPVEWAAGHIEGAKNVELANLQDFLKKVPVEHPLAMICGMGYRSSLAASLLQSAGFTDVGSVWRYSRLACCWIAFDPDCYLISLWDRAKASGLRIAEGVVLT